MLCRVLIRFLTQQQLYSIKQIDYLLQLQKLHITGQIFYYSLQKINQRSKGPIYDPKANHQPNQYSEIRPLITTKFIFSQNYWTFFPVLQSNIFLVINKIMGGDEQLSNSSNKDTKRKRRPRTESNDRNYICSCGKSYLSYPALYTHIKNKHDGKAPGMVQMPRTDKGNKVKKYNFKVDDEDNDEQVQKPSSYYIEQFVKFFQCFTTFRQPYYLKPLVEKLPSGSSKPLIAAIDKWEQGKVEQIMLQNGAYNTSIDLVFAKFIMQLSTKVEKGIFIQVLILLHIWRECLNQYPATQQCQKRNDFDSNCLNILEVVNHLMSVYFKQNIPKLNHISQEHHLLDESKPKLMNKSICKFIYLFSKWLFSEKYVNTVLGINKMSEVVEEE